MRTTRSLNPLLVGLVGIVGLSLVGCSTAAAPVASPSPRPATAPPASAAPRASQAAASTTPEAMLLVLSALATVAVPLVFFGDSRFKVPAIPLLIVAAAAAVTRFEPRDDPAGSGV